MEEKYDKKQIGLRLKEFRCSLHITQKEFALSLNWTPESYRKIETGKVLITTDKLQQLYITYHIDIGYILTGEHSMVNELTDDSLLNLHLCANEEQWLAMQMRMLQYYQNIKKKQ
ncbi:MAG: helix-turn-helix domain-containing protein [Lachnospiraceae bacterium]